MWRFMRLLYRAAAFFGTMPLRDMLSIMGMAALNAALAVSFCLVSMAARTFLMTVRSIERAATFRSRRPTACRARLLACFVFAKVAAP